MKTRLHPDAVHDHDSRRANATAGSLSGEGLNDSEWTISTIRRKRPSISAQTWGSNLRRLGRPRVDSSLCLFCLSGSLWPSQFAGRRSRCRAQKFS